MALAALTEVAAAAVVVAVLGPVVAPSFKCAGLARMGMDSQGSREAGMGAWLPGVGAVALGSGPGCVGVVVPLLLGVVEAV